jgi:hypothetical protein
MHFESTKKPRGLLYWDRTLFCPIWRRPKSSSRTEDNLSKLAASDADGFGFAAAILFILATPYARMLLKLTISSIPLRLLGLAGTEGGFLTLAYCTQCQGYRLGARKSHMPLGMMWASGSGQ